MPRRARNSLRAVSAAAVVGPITTEPSQETRIVERSRPTASQWRCSASSFCGISATGHGRLLSSAYCATSRRVFFSPAPPIMIGGAGDWIGAGELIASFTR